MRYHLKLYLWCSILMLVCAILDLLRAVLGDLPVDHGELAGLEGFIGVILLLNWRVTHDLHDVVKELVRDEG